MSAVCPGRSSEVTELKKDLARQVGQERWKKVDWP